MGNKISEHGGFFNLGTISHGTLRPQDLLRSFADELERLWPFNQTALLLEARDAAAALDATEQNDSKPDAARIYESAGYTLERLMDELGYVAAAHGATFDTLEGDGSDFGFWPSEDCDEVD